MSTAREISEFLKSRRDRITPEQVGLGGGRTSRRRVSGLRREEVALLAGISVEYYIQVERGRVGGVSEDVLESIARTLQLDDIERTHLFDLVHAVKQRPTSRRRSPRRLRPSVQTVLDAMTESAAFVRNGRLDILTANRLGYALYSDAFADPDRPVNLARFVFSDPSSHRFYADWSGIADAAVGSLRAEAGRNPYDRDLTELIDELSTRSDEFRTRWATHDVRRYATGTQHFRHPLVGDLELTYEALELTADIGLTLVAYAAQPGSPSHDALIRLRSSGPTPVS